ncbi:MAG: hypothetical protein ACREXT_15925, partial [Gammaproteobacteria bacterium]
PVPPVVIPLPRPKTSLTLTLLEIERTGLAPEIVAEARPYTSFTERPPLWTLRKSSAKLPADTSTTAVATSHPRDMRD